MSSGINDNITVVVLYGYCVYRSLVYRPSFVCAAVHEVVQRAGFRLTGRKDDHWYVINTNTPKFSRPIVHEVSE